ALERQVPLFVLFNFISLFTLSGNLGMMLLILLDSHLHTPMYFFLTTVTPKVMDGLLITDKVIYNVHAAQMFFLAVFATVESYFLISVAYDRYTVICKPPHHTTTMTANVCASVAIHSSEIHHFFCDILAVMTLIYSNKHINELILAPTSSFNIFFTLLVILISCLFVFVFVIILKMKVLSTCGSHLTAVSLFYGTVLITYMQPSFIHFMNTEKLYLNNEVKSAFKNVVEETKYFLCLVF
ncbi:hypothetical protein H8957_016233, partial [Semnopithecus entellus]